MILYIEHSSYQIIMALVQGIHLLAHGNKIDARRIAQDIQQYQRLYIGIGSVYGSGVYAWYRDHLPTDLQTWPQVVFEIDNSRIVPIRKRDGTALGFFRIPGPAGSYVSIHVLTFANLW